MVKDINKIVAYGFVVSLTAAGITNFFWPEQGFSEAENRYLKKMPDFTVAAFLDGSFGMDYEEALSDQFPHRNQWVALNVLAERMQGKTSINGVYIGRDHYLLEKFEMEDLETEQAAKNIASAAKAVSGWQALLGPDHVRVMMVPSASQVLKEKLPLFAAPYDQQSVAEDLINASGVPELFVPVEEKLASHREEEIYYRTDHHWTSLGAYYGYAAWARSLDMTPWNPEDFEIIRADNEFLGTIQSKLNISAVPDGIDIYQPKREMKYQVFYDLAETASDTLYSFDALTTKDKYRVFLDGNHALTQIDNLTLQAEPETGQTGKKLLIVKDSFAHTFAPFAANHFETTYLVDLRYYNGDIMAFAEEHGITDILLLYQIPGFCGERTVGKL